MKIALLFLTNKDLNHPILWKQAIEEAPDCFNLYIHSKEPLESIFFQPFRIEQTIPTTYLNHVRAWQALIATAILNPENTKFVLLSESCIPLYPLKDIYSHLIKDAYSYMSYRRPWWESDASREVTDLPSAERWGNVEWIILNRKHAEMIAQDSIMIDIVSRYPYDSESYFSILLGVKGVLGEVVCKQTTYAKFTDSKGTHAYSFTGPSLENTRSINQAKRAGCLFARKFMSQFSEEILQSVQHSFSRPMLHTDWMDSKLISQEYLAEMSLANTGLILPMLIRDLKLQVGCEIGVSSGLHVERILQETSIKELYGIDSYEGQDVLYSIFKDRLSFVAPGRGLLVRKKACEAVKEVPKDALDYLFFHGEYLVESTENLLEMWFDKVREGGIICGWYLDGFKVDIARSIKLFFDDKKLTIHSDYIEAGFWWINK